MKVKNYYLMRQEKELDSMQAELSRLSEQWSGDDGSPDIDMDAEYQQHADELLKEKSPF